MRLNAFNLRQSSQSADAPPSPTAFCRSRGAIHLELKKVRHLQKRTGIMNGVYFHARTFRPLTRLNSRAFPVTRVASRLRAWAAMRRSNGPMIAPFASKSARICPALSGGNQVEMITQLSRWFVGNLKRRRSAAQTACWRQPAGHAKRGNETVTTEIQWLKSGTGTEGHEVKDGAGRGPFRAGRIFLNSLGSFATQGFQTKPLLGLNFVAFKTGNCFLFCPLSFPTGSSPQCLQSALIRSIWGFSPCVHGVTS